MAVAGRTVTALTMAMLDGERTVGSVLFGRTVRPAEAKLYLKEKG